MANNLENATINVVREDVLKGSLVDIMRVNKGIFLDAVSMVFDKKRDMSASAIDNQTAAYKALTNNIESMGKRLFDSDTRGKSLIAEKQLAVLDKKISDDKDITESEKESLNMMIQELKGVNRNLLNNEHSLMKSFSSTLKDNLPSLTGVLGAVGLNNPAFIFLGSMMQGIADKRKESQLAEQAMIEEHHKEKLKADLDSIDITKKQEQATGTLDNSLQNQTLQNEQILDQNDAQVALLQHISTLMQVIVKDTKAQQFAEIEKAREANRRDERLVDAISSIGDKFEENVLESAEDTKKGIFSGMMGEISGFMNSIMATLIVAKSFLGRSAKALFKVAKRFAGPIGIALTAVEFFQGAAKGWNEAAIKLGKESATTSDKMASAIGGGLASVVSIGDSLLGLVGFETDMAGYVDQKTTEILAAGFETISGWADSFMGMINKVGQWYSNFENMVADFAIKAVDTVTNSIKTLFTGWMDISFPEGEFSFSDIVLIPLRQVRHWLVTLFDWELPEIPSMDDMFGEQIDKVTDSIKGIFDSVLDVFEGFSIKKLLPWGNDEPEIKEPKATSGKRSLFKRLWSSTPEELEAIEKEKPIKAEQETIVPSTIKDPSDSVAPNTTIVPRVRKTKLTQGPVPVEMPDREPAEGDVVWPLPLDISASDKMTEFMPTQTRAEVNGHIGQIVSNEAVQREKEQQNGTANIISAPSTSNVNNVANNTNLHQTPMSPHDTDSTFARMQSHIGH